MINPISAIKTAGRFLADHIVKIVIAVLVAFVIAAVAKCEREEQRQNNTLVTTGEQKATITQQEGIIRNVEKANDAERNISLDADQRLRDRYDRCTSDPASCE